MSEAIESRYLARYRAISVDKKRYEFTVVAIVCHVLLRGYHPFYNRVNGLQVRRIIQ